MTPVLLACVLTAPAIATWYGPSVVAFRPTFSGNPYDPDENDAWVTFKGPKGVTERRLAYYDSGSWKSALVGHTPGKYTATLTINGKQAGAAATVLRAPIKDGFVRTGGRWGFQYDSGKLYWPLGHNLGWQSGDGFPDLTAFLKTMGENGINWSRIWACTWDGKNPWWPNDKTKLSIGELWPKALDRWDAIVKAADAAGVHFQFVLFHHGEFSSTTDSNWNDNPWNAKNGGFLSDPVQFFTDGLAKKLAREWVRYAIARWGYSPAIMSWEIFNEVQWTDGIHKDPETVGKWHDEMAAYIRSLDANHHLVTTSSSEQKMPVFRKVDYWQPHGYPARVAPMVLSAPRPDSRPLFFGEVGPGQLRGGGPTQVLAVRDGIWSGLLALHSGAAEYWSWDLVPRYHLHREYAQARKILTESHVLSEAGLKRIRIDLDSGVGGDLRLAPGGGWEATTQFDYNLPDDANAMGHLSAYFQGMGHPDFRREPVRFHFVAPKSGMTTIGVSAISGTGGNLKASVSDGASAQRLWAGGTHLADVETLKVPYPAGPVTITLDNDGPDWVQIAFIDLPGIAARASATAIGNSRFLLARIERHVAEPVEIAVGPLADGNYHGVMTDLDTGVARQIELRVRRGRTDQRIELHSADAILWLRKRAG